jgi:putative transposase
MHKGFKTRICPNKIQQKYLDKCFDIARFAWNYGVENWKEMYQEELKPNGYKISAKLIIERDIKYPWLKEVNSMVYSDQFNNLQESYNSFFKKISSKPKFKSRKNTKQSFNIHRKTDKIFKFTNQTFSLVTTGRESKKRSNRLNIRTTEKVGFLKKYKVVELTISKVNNNYYASFIYEYNKVKKNNNTNKVGIDLGIKNFITQSDGKIFNYPKKVSKTIKKISKFQQKLSKKVKDSNNCEKARVKLRKEYLKLTNIKEDFIHKYTTKVCKEYKHICIEDLSVSNMLKNKSISSSIYKMNFYRVKEIFKYKSLLFDNDLVIVDRFYPSSKTCSKCGYINKELSLKDRVYKCPICNLGIDRDLNASLNLANQIDACGQHESLNGCLVGS